MALSRTGATKALQLDAGYDRGAGMKFKIYSGSAPVNADAALSGNTLLAGLVFGATPFAAAVAVGNAATKTSNAITSDSDADATGTATFARITKSDDTVVAQCSVSAAGGGGDAILNSTSIVQHTLVSCSSLVITAGA